MFSAECIVTVQCEVHTSFVAAPCLSSLASILGILKFISTL